MLVRVCTMRFAACVMLLSLTVSLASCNKSGSASASATQQRTFASPEAAANTLAEAAKSYNQSALLAIFGESARDLIYTGDATQDKENLEGFVSAYDVMNRWRKVDDKTELLIVGSANNPFPIPLVKNDSGQWYFDTLAGKDELKARLIGRDELSAIDVCQALADAQNEYFSQHHDGERKKEYALKFVSDNGKQNGLYWQSPEGQPRSPLGPLVAFATSEGYDVKAASHEPFHGYYFRMLNKQGSDAQGGAKDYVVDEKMVKGFAFVAYPADYGNSGIMTFMINQDGIVYQKDLGNGTAQAASSMTTFDPDKSWAMVEE